MRRGSSGVAASEPMPRSAAAGTADVGLDARLSARSPGRSRGAARTSCVQARDVQTSHFVRPPACPLRERTMTASLHEVGSATATGHPIRTQVGQQPSGIDQDLAVRKIYRFCLRCETFLSIKKMERRSHEDQGLRPRFQQPQGPLTPGQERIPGFALASRTSTSNRVGLTSCPVCTIRYSPWHIHSSGPSVP
jgi:hypothetical protein